SLSWAREEPGSILQRFLKVLPLIISYLRLQIAPKLMISQSSCESWVRMMRDLHQLVSDRAHTLTAHEEVCFWQDSVLLLALVSSTHESYQRAMNDVVMLKEAIDGLHPCHAVSVKGQSFPAPIVSQSCRKPRTIYLSASSLAFSNCFKIEGELRNQKADWYIDSRITAKVKTRAADHIKSIILLPRNVSRKIHVYHNSFR
ncbi:MAG TPA: hypothetical protein VIT23_07115, partial [Terrimicrobiaceae bacterium]